jgi:hypothetical protein
MIKNVRERHLNFFQIKHKFEASPWFEVMSIYYLDN